MKYILTLILFITYFFTFSQEIYKKGKVFQNNGDTLKGYIGNIFDSKSVFFKENLNSKQQELSPDKISGFELEGNIYLSKKVLKNDYIFNKSLKSYPFVSNGIFLEKNEDFVPYWDSVFVQRLLKGKISLFELNTKDATKGFYAEKNEKLVELPPVYFEFKKDTTRGYGYFIRNGIYNMIPNFSGTYTQRKYFLDTLRSLIIDDAEYYLKPLDYNLNCERNELIEFINNYDQKYPEENNSIIYQKRRGKKYFGLNAGTVFPTHYLSFESYDRMVTTGSRTFGLFVLFPLYKENINLSYRVGFQQYYFKSQLYLRNKNLGEDINILNSINFGIRYSFMKGIIRPYGGYSISVMKRQINEYKQQFTFPAFVEYGILIPVKRINFFVGGERYPILKSKRHVFQFNAFNAGILF